LAQHPRQNPQEILRMHVLRTADKARHGLFDFRFASGSAADF
jgi:hypothetical protein